jgi:hypothetical protein
MLFAEPDLHAYYNYGDTLHCGYEPLRQLIELTTRCRGAPPEGPVWRGALEEQPETYQQRDAYRRAREFAMLKPVSRFEGL